VVVDMRLAAGPHELKIAVPNGPATARKVTLKKSDRFLVISENMSPYGKVLLDTRPQGARLLLDGAEIGKSPLALPKVSTDRAHIVEARLDGYASANATIPVDREESFELTVPLLSTRPDGQIVLESSPPAELSMDGQPWGRTGAVARACPAGAHEVTLKAPGTEVTYTVQVPEKGSARYFFDLRASL
jgi:hypothetical protein